MGANEDLVDHRDRIVAPNLEQEDLARGDTPARERPDVHEMGDQDDDLSWREAEQESTQLSGLPVGAVRVAEERMARTLVEIVRLGAIRTETLFASRIPSPVKEQSHA